MIPPSVRFWVNETATEFVARHHGWQTAATPTEKDNCWYALREEYQQALDARQRFRRQGHNNTVYFKPADNRRKELLDRGITNINDDDLTWIGPYGMEGSIGNRLDHRCSTFKVVTRE